MAVYVCLWVRGGMSRPSYYHHRKCLMRELFEGDRVDEVPVVRTEALPFTRAEQALACTQCLIITSHTPFPSLFTPITGDSPFPLHSHNNNRRPSTTACAWWPHGTCPDTHTVRLFLPLSLCCASYHQRQSHHATRAFCFHCLPLACLCLDRPSS